MASAIAATPLSTQGEILLQGDGVSLCLVVNRRMRSLRVIDFRSGANPAKGRKVVQWAQQEGLERVFTLVEREEMNSWVRLGFQREGSIPGFYKRSDAWILGATLDRLVSSKSEESGVRRVPVTDDEPGAERLLNAAKRLAKERAPADPSAVKIQVVKESELAKSVSAAIRQGRDLTGFEPFGRDFTRYYYLASGRAGFSLAISAESQVCFDNALVEILTGPRSEKESAMTRSALHWVCEELHERGVVGCFATSPTTDVELSAVYLSNGFRKTGRLRSHVLRDGVRTDAFLWSRRLALPADS